MSLPNIFKSQTVWELWPAQVFSFRGRKKVRVVSLARDMPTGLCLYWILSKYFKPLRLMAHTRIKLGNLLRGNGQKVQSKSFSSCMRYSYLTWYRSLPNIIQSSQTVWKICPTKDFGFRGDKYKMKMKVVSLARDTPSGPPLRPYQILSKYLWGYQNYGAHNGASEDGQTPGWSLYPRTYLVGDKKGWSLKQTVVPVLAKS